MRFMTSDRTPARLAWPIVPLVDIAFLLLIYFVLNLKIVAAERNFRDKLPIDAPSKTVVRQLPSVIRVGLMSDTDGHLTQVTIGQRELGHDDAAFDRLNAEILKSVVHPGNPLAKEIEVEIHADYELHYKYIVRAVSTCTGRLDPQTKQVVRYVEKIKFAPPVKPRTLE